MSSSETHLSTCCALARGSLALLVNRAGMTDVSLSFFLTDKGKEGSVKKERPYKVFFKDLFLFKENEVAAKKKVKFC